MTVWRVATIDEEPEIVLVDWKIWQVRFADYEEMSLHFVGYSVHGREGRVSSAILEFDRDALIGKTQSGRTYKLSGKSGYNSDGEYVWARWCSINQVSEAVLFNMENL